MAELSTEFQNTWIAIWSVLLNFVFFLTSNIFMHQCRFRNIIFCYTLQICYNVISSR